MMTYGFKARFADALLMDTKLSTIRAPRKDGRLPLPREKIRRYTGMRTKNCRWLGDRFCVRVTPITITQFFVRLTPFKAGIVTLPILSGRIIRNARRLDWLAVRDGFKDWPEMIGFFSTVHSLPFHGWLIEWETYAETADLINRTHDDPAAALSAFSASP